MTQIENSIQLRLVYVSTLACCSRKQGKHVKR